MIEQSVGINFEETVTRKKGNLTENNYIYCNLSLYVAKLYNFLLFFWRINPFRITLKCRNLLHKNEMSHGMKIQHTRLPVSSSSI